MVKRRREADGLTGGRFRWQATLLPPPAGASAAGLNWTAWRRSNRVGQILQPTDYI